MQQAQAKAETELTCWKCGEESLKETGDTGVSRGPHGELLASTQLHHSVCEKCGSYAVNPAQSIHNKHVARRARKALIREANRSST
jgi:hypothetical protein